MKPDSDNTLYGIIHNPKRIQKYSIEEFKKIVNNSSWKSGTLMKGNHVGEGFKAYDNRGNLIQWHPGTSRHFDGEAYWKVSNSANNLPPERFTYLGG